MNSNNNKSNYNCIKNVSWHHDQQIAVLKIHLQGPQNNFQSGGAWLLKSGIISVDNN